jgi:hypothetical protein
MTNVDEAAGRALYERQRSAARADVTLMAGLDADAAEDLFREWIGQ